MPSKTIVVGIDFSLPSARALEQSRVLADTLAAGLEVVHVSAPHRNWMTGEDEAGWLEREGVAGEDLRIRRGTPWVELARHAAEKDSLLIVVGSHGRRGYHPVSLGATAFKLALGAPRPVLVVGQRTGGSEGGTHLPPASTTEGGHNALS